jgi:hypothetical protein
LLQTDVMGNTLSMVRASVSGRNVRRGAVV